MRIGFFIAAIVLNVVAVLSLASVSRAHAAEKLTIGLIGSPDSGGWLYYIALHEGYFAQEEIEPDFIYVPTAPGVMQQLVSGSLDVYLGPWCERHGLALICNRLESRDGRLTGRYADGDRGGHKAGDIRSRYDLSCYDRIHAYGDSREDRPMLALAHERWYRGRRIA